MPTARPGTQLRVFARGFRSTEGGALGLGASKQARERERERDRGGAPVLRTAEVVPHALPKTNRQRDRQTDDRHTAGRC